MNIEVMKITGVKLLQRANGFTTGRESHMTLAKAYRHGHSPIRTQLFWVEATEIPLYVASQLVRSHIGVQFFQRSKRPDRGGMDFRDECKESTIALYSDVATIEDELRMVVHPDNINPDTTTIGEALNDVYCIASRIEEYAHRFDRYTPTDIAFIINAEALINMAHKRLCTKASIDTRIFMMTLRNCIHEVDPDLAAHMVPQCVYRNGICPEPKPCHYCEGHGSDELDMYQRLFKDNNK